MYPTGAPGYYVLNIQRPQQQQESRSIDRPVITIGRSAGDIALGDPLSSGRHAEIYFQNGQVYVRDMGSTNGTYFNGMRMPEFVLQPGQSFQCGQTLVTLMGIYGAAPPPAAYQAPNPALAATVAAASPPAYAPPQAQPAYAQHPPQAGTPPPQLYGQGQYPQQQVYGGPQGYPPPPAAPMNQAYGGYGGYPGYGQPPMQPPPQQMPPGGSPSPAAGYGPPPGAMVPAASSAPAPQPMSPVSPQVGGVRVNLAITGGELFAKLFLGGLLTMITFGIYLPWLICSLQRYLQSKVTIGPTSRGNLRLTFTGTGGQLFVLGLVNYLLCVVTLFIYYPWFLAKMIRFFTDHTHAQADDGTQVQLRFEATGGDLFVPMLVGVLLSWITVGIYIPWFLCSLQRLILGKTKLCENSIPVGGFEFSGTGGRLIGTFLLGWILTMVTFGIYLSWFQVKLFRFFAQNTRVEYHGHRWVGDFMGKGLDLFLINLVGALLLPLTLFIYFFWLLAKQLRFQIGNLVFHQMS